MRLGPGRFRSDPDCPVCKGSGQDPTHAHAVSCPRCSEDRSSTRDHSCSELKDGLKVALRAIKLIEVALYECVEYLDLRDAIRAIIREAGL